MQRMFSKWIIYLLKYYDFCGFHTELNKPCQTGINMFIIHILMASFLTCSTLIFAMQPTVSADISLNMVNNSIQYSSGLIAYWMIIMESYIQRKHQRHFWTIYKQACHQNCRHKSPNLRNYLLLFFEYFLIFSLIQIYLMEYFFFFVGSFIYFMFTYHVLVKMYQNRIFYYLFYVELIKHELITIQKELKRLVAISKSDNFVWERNRYANLRKYYQLIYEMVCCLNEIFGWSQFTTILFCLHLPLTDLNWAYIRIHERSTGYIIGTVLGTFKNVNLIQLILQFSFFG